LNAAAVGRLKRVFESLSSKPGYTLMRGFARFSTLRLSIPFLRAAVLKIKGRSHRDSLELEGKETCFPDVDIDSVVSALRKDGVAFGFRLPDEVVQSIRSYAEEALCFADRAPAYGFKIEHRERAEEMLNKKILVAQYFNTLSENPEIARLAQDPTLKEIARRFLNSPPTFVGANLWWTFPVEATEEDRHRHAHKFHRDVDDFKFFKFFFYLTDVEKGDGAHVVVAGSQGKPPINGFFDRWNIRRYTDQEIAENYSPSQVKEIDGRAGDGFAEDTWCIHKGQTPVRKPRLLLQLQFALFDYNAMHDQRSQELLQRLA